MNNTKEIIEIELKISELREEKRKLIEENRSTEKLVTINLKFCTTVKDSMELLSRIKAAIKQGFDLRGICPPSEIEVKKINIKE